MRAVHLQQMVPQNYILGNLQCGTEGTKSIGAHHGVGKNLVRPSVEQLHHALLGFPDLDIPMLHTKEEGRKLHRLARAVYCPIGIYCHTRLFLLRGSIIVVAFVISDLGQTTIRPQRHMHHLLLFVHQHRSLWAWFARASIHHGDACLLAWHVHNKILQGGHHKVHLNLFWFLFQTHISLALQLQGVAPRHRGSQEYVLAHQFATSIQHLPLHLLNIECVQSHTQGVAWIVHLGHGEPHTRSEFFYRIVL